jgi:hypothetical protein
VPGPLLRLREPEVDTLVGRVAPVAPGQHGHSEEARAER